MDTEVSWGTARKATFRGAGRRGGGAEVKRRIHSVAVGALESELARFQEPRHWLDRHHADAALIRREGHAEPPGSDILGNQGRTTLS